MLGLGLHWLSRHLERSTLALVIILHTVANIVVAFYLGFFHQRGTISVIHDLAGAVSPGDQVVFLTPCHATPFHSHIHADNVTLRFLDCSPDIVTKQGGEHEEARFYKDAGSWWDGYSAARLVQKFSSEYVVVFEGGDMHVLLKREGYVVEKRYFFAHLLLDQKLAHHIFLYKKTF